MPPPPVTAESRHRARQRQRVTLAPSSASVTGPHPRPRRPPGSTLVGVKGDRVEVLVDVGGGVRQFDIRATKAGRRVEVSSARGITEVTEVTRSGQAVRTA